MKGQATLEFLSLFLLLSISAAATVFLIWISFLNFRLKDLLHEALVCRLSASIDLPKRQTHLNCELKLKNEVRNFIGAPRVEFLRWHKNVEAIGVDLVLKLDRPQGLTYIWKISRLQFHQEIQLPLTLSN